jgi:riboflavin-specific deaminase-like protein
LVDAVVGGVGTVVADDPQLNVRHETGPAPARVVIDPSGRLPAGAKCLRDDGARRIVVHSRSVARPRLDTTPGVEFLPLALSSRGLDPADILEALAGVGLRRILVEGGAVTLSRFLAAGCLNRLHVLVAPIIIGAGPMGITLPPIARLDEALRPAVATFALPGGDMLFDCDFSGLKEGS